MNNFLRLVGGTLLGLMLWNTAEAGNNKYRLTLRDNPATSIVVGWNQTSGSNPTVYYGTTDHGTNWSAYGASQSPDRVVSAFGMSNHFARLSGLQANTAYYFVIRDSEGTSQRFWFKTAPNDPTQRLSFLAGGDSRNNRTPRINANRLVAKLRPHAVLFGGDMTDNGTSTQWQNWFDDWQYTIGSDGRMIPFVATRGNHEGSNSYLVNLFDVPSSNVYYALTFGGSLVRTYTLNTEMSIGGSQTTWLQNDLQANQNSVSWKMAQYHKPMRPHVGGKSEGNSQYNYWAQLFYDYGVKLVVECDAHTVKSTWPVRPSTGGGADEGFIRDDANGTVYVGEGCWGAPLRSNNDNKTWTRNSGSFNQIKWIFVDQAKIETRTLRTDNASQVGTVNDNNIFAAPANLDIWNPSNGAVITILNTNVTPPTISVTAPAEGTSYSSAQSITLQASASDADGSVSSVQFFVNGSSVGTDNSAPYSRSYSLPGNGAYAITAKATDNEGNSTTSAPVSITVGVVAQSTSSRINQGGDDVEEAPDGGVYTNSSDIELVYDSYNGGTQVVGLYFRNLGIPQGATITGARVQFTADETGSGSANLTIRAHDTDAAPAFSTSNGNVSGRATTSASVNWSPSAWSSAGATGSAQATPDLKDIVQELVNRGGWSSTSNVALIISGSGTRTAEAYDGSAGSAALLTVDYVVGGGDGGSDPNDAPSVSLTSPSNGSSQVGLSATTLAASASDADGSISSVVFKVNGATVGTDGTSPYSITWTPGSYGTYSITATATDNDGASTTSSGRSITYTQSSSTPTTVSARVSAGNDDAEEAQSGSMYLNSSDLELVYDSHNSAGNQQVGMVFRGHGIPAGATITNAYIQFTADETKNDAGTKYIYGHDVDDSYGFSSSTGNISSRSKTSASVSWSPGTWGSVGAAGSAQRTPDLSGIIQEIVNRGGYANGNDIGIIITGSGRKTAESYNGSSSRAPLLVVTYTSGAARGVVAFDTQANEPVETQGMNLQALEVKAYPNPVQNRFTLSIMAADLDGPAYVRVVDLNGRTVYSASLHVHGPTQHEVATQGWAPGMYVIAVSTDQGKYSLQVQK